ncbi:hypothetical protein [Kitasatospora sp. NPDC001175]|uniref:hypothetical protein n=1 Tax=Kitasatospora sp. NPDC001175 TaxID=3157103 RepID=UPI003D005A62
MTCTRRRWGCSRASATPSARPRSHTLLGDALLALDAPASALQHYRAAIEYLPHTGERYDLGRIHLAGRPELLPPWRCRAVLS